MLLEVFAFALHMQVRLVFCKDAGFYFIWKFGKLPGKYFWKFCVPKIKGNTVFKNVRHLSRTRMCLSLYLQKFLKSSDA